MKFIHKCKDYFGKEAVEKETRYEDMPKLEV